MARTSRRPQAARTQDSDSATISHYDRDRVAARAYEIYMERGGAGGSDMDDWLAAEREFTTGDPARHDEDE